jgi:predicted transposase YdaD
MDWERLHNPHDRLVRLAFSRVPTALSFFRCCMPLRIFNALEWKALRVKSGSYIDAKLKLQEIDLLFELKWKGKRFLLYLLFEHQSRVERWMGLRLLGYKHAIWNEAIKEQPRRAKVPPILPLVLYCGKRPWTTPCRWSDCLEIPEGQENVLNEFQLDFSYLLVDLSHLSAEDIQGDLVCRLTVGLMKAVMQGRVLKWLAVAAPLLVELSRKSDVTGMLEALLRYLMAAESRVSYQKIVTLLRKKDAPEIANKAMSIADQLIEEGIYKGEQTGQIRLLQELLKLPVTSSAVLAKKTPSERTRLLNKLRRQLGVAR